jgi:putative transcriptional regulator
MERMNLIREVLDRNNISQYKLAKDTGLTYVTIQNYYHGKREPSLENLFKIAKVLKVSPKDLLNCV